MQRKEAPDGALLTAAYKTLPFGTRVTVTHGQTQRTVTVRINDRGPVQAGRIPGLSPATAKGLGIGPDGLGEVKAEVLAAAAAKAGTQHRAACCGAVGLGWR